jgi:general secretion pathway protein D
VYRLQRTDAFRVLCAVALLVATSCASQRTANQGEEAMHNHNWDAAVYYYLEALANDPENIEYRMALVRARQRAAQEHFARGMSYKNMGNLMSAKEEFQMAIQLDSTHQFAEQELEQVEADIDVLAGPDGAQTLAEMKKRAREAKVQQPILDPKSAEPITLKFPKPKPVKEIYNAMAKAYGFNVLFDPKLKDDKLTLELNEVTAKQALEIVCQAAGHFYKVLDDHTIIVVEESPQNRREYEDLVIKTFFLSNADVKDVDKLLRSLIEARRLSTSEQLNSITLRDTADKVAIAERLIAINDKAKAEVLIDVELIEVDSTNMQELGVKLSTYSIGLNLDPTRVTEDGGETIYLPDLSGITRSAWSVTVPNVLINLVKSTTKATSLAQPQLRITEGEKGALHIGQRTPIPVTSFNTSQTVGGNIVPVTSYQYQDVGIRIDVEPRVHHNREITLKVTVEVSAVAGYSEGGQPIIGTRTINTVIRLKDGETNMLVGLYKEDTSQTKTEMPLLSKIPLLGRLFTNDNKSRQVTDLVLTLTPHIIRFPDIQEADLAPLWVGTESRISFHGNSPRVQSGTVDEGPFDSGEPENERAAPDRDPGGREGGARPSFRRLDQLRRPGAAAGDAGEGGGLPRLPSPSPLQEAEPETGEADGRSLQPLEVVETLPGEDPLQPKSASSPEEPQISIEPSIVSLRPDEVTQLHLVLRGGRGWYRLPVGLSFDPAGIQVDTVELAPGVVLVDGQESEAEGLLTMELVVGNVVPDGTEIAVVNARGIRPGAVPIVLATDGGVNADGERVPMAVSDGAVYVLDEAGDGEGSS